MHARIDNPELIKAQELKIPIFSYPEYIYNQSTDKKSCYRGESWKLLLHYDITFYIITIWIVIIW